MKHLVLLHGWGASERIWQRQVEAFGEEYPVLAPRILEWNAAWLDEYLTRLPLRASVLVGWSLGGMLLLEALDRLKGAGAGCHSPGGGGPGLLSKARPPLGSAGGLSPGHALRSEKRSDPGPDEFSGLLSGSRGRIVSRRGRGGLRFHRRPG